MTRFHPSPLDGRTGSDARRYDRDSASTFPARREIAADVLADRRPPVDLAALAAAVAERDCAEDRPDRPAGRVAVELHHCDLPRLDDRGLIEYDWNEKRVERIEGLTGVPDA